MSEFPVFDPKTLSPLRVIQAEMARNPAYLDDPDCPYSPELCDFLSVFAVGSGVLPGKSVFLGQNGDKWSILESEAQGLYDDLKKFGTIVQDSDVNERMGYFRTATSLLEKIVGINERAIGLKQVHDFHQAVLAVFEDELTNDQRTRVINRLRSAIDSTGKGE